MSHFIPLFLTLSFILDVAQAEDPPIKVACVGDSITYGGRVENREINCYPVKLGELLEDGYLVKNFGLSGSTILSKGNKPYVKSKEYKTAREFQPDLVIIKLGTNDSKERNWMHSADYISDYVKLIKTFQGLESKPKIWVCYPVKAYSAKGPIKGDVIEKEVIPMIGEVVEETGVSLIDLYSVLDKETYYHTDLVHPNAEGAALIAKTVYEAIK